MGNRKRVSMDEGQAKELVIRAGLKLVETGLIARTWGNVSCRIDDQRFAVTPSGKAYETLTPSDIVTCRIEDASYSGNVKPSSEKGIHALLYRKRPDVGFVIHTHQKYASAVAASPISRLPDCSVPKDRGASTLPSHPDGAHVKCIPVAPYGLPGSKRLMRGVAKVLDQADSSLLLSHHGALCFGADYDAAFTNAHRLEEVSRQFLEDNYLKASGAESFDFKEMIRYYVFGEQSPSEKEMICRSEHKPPDEIRKAICRARPDIKYIHCASEDLLMILACGHNGIRPMLDDFAQIVGPSVRVAADIKDIINALNHRQGVLIPGLGAFCCASTEEDAYAIYHIMEKTALAEMCASFLGTPKPISKLDCLLMRRFYKKSYSRRIR